MPNNYKYNTVNENQFFQDFYSVVTPELLEDHLFFLSMICKSKQWHETGVHLCAAGDRLQKMREKGLTRQKSIRTIKSMARQVPQSECE